MSSSNSHLAKYFLLSWLNVNNQNVINELSMSLVVIATLTILASKWHNEKQTSSHENDGDDAICIL